MTPPSDTKSEKLTGSPPSEGRPMEHLFIIYDERAMGGNTDDAAVLCTAKSLKEARSDVRTMFPRGVIYQYDVRGDQLVNERFAAFPASEVR